MHQHEFRQRVLRAYREQCAICRLHHAAFDRHFLGVRPDLTVELRPALLREPDGPMLKYGLQGFHDSRLALPRDPALRPNLDFVEERCVMFRKAG
jgi:putative restriction endonuclease